MSVTFCDDSLDNFVSARRTRRRHGGRGRHFRLIRLLGGEFIGIEFAVLILVVFRERLGVRGGVVDGRLLGRGRKADEARPGECEHEQLRGQGISL